MAVQSYDDWLLDARRQYLITILSATKFNQSQAAELAGIHRNTLKRMLLDSGLSTRDIRRLRTNQNPQTHLKNGAAHHA